MLQKFWNVGIAALALASSPSLAVTYTGEIQGSGFLHIMQPLDDFRTYRVTASFSELSDQFWLVAQGDKKYVSNNPYDSGNELCCHIDYSLSLKNTRGPIVSWFNSGGSTRELIGGYVYDFFYVNHFAIIDASFGGLPTFYRIDIDDVGSAPEPETWALMILGFALAGMAARKHQTYQESARPIR